MHPRGKQQLALLAVLTDTYILIKMRAPYFDRPVDMTTAPPDERSDVPVCLDTFHTTQLAASFERENGKS
jgi:hypothetical protein